MWKNMLNFERFKMYSTPEVYPRPQSTPFKFLNTPLQLKQMSDTWSKVGVVYDEHWYDYIVGVGLIVKQQLGRMGLP